MPFLFVLIIVAVLVCASSYRWKRTPEQRKEALEVIRKERGNGEIQDYLDGGALRFTISGLPAELRLYALPKEPLGVSTEILIDLPEGFHQELECVADRLMPSVRHALGGTMEDYDFESLFRICGQQAHSLDPDLVSHLMDLWKLGPPRHVRFCIREDKLMVSKDVDLCDSGKLRRFVSISESLVGILTERRRANHGNAVG